MVITMKILKTFNALLLCSLVTGCATPMNTYLPAHLLQEKPTVSHQSLSVNQLLAKARGDHTLSTTTAADNRLHIRQTSQAEHIALRFKANSSALTMSDQRKLQQYSRSSDTALLYIKCGASGDSAIDNFRIALHRCKNIQRFLKLILQDSKAQVTSIQPLQYVSISTSTAMQGIQ